MWSESRSKWSGVGLLLFVFASTFLLWGVVSHQRYSRTDTLPTNVQRYQDLSWAGQGVALASAQPTYNAVSKQDLVQTSNTPSPAISRSSSSAVVQRTQPTAGGDEPAPIVQHDHGYLLELYSSDALTGGAMNILSYQCMVSKLSPKLIVVEPFVLPTAKYGAVLEVEDKESFDRENNVKLRDIYDIEVWNKASDGYHYNRLAPWESFITDAPRDLILVENQWWRDCNLSALIEKFSGFFKTFNFRIVKMTCLNFRKSGAMNAGQFKGVVYGEYAPEQVTVIIDRLPGIGGVSPFNTAVEGQSCSKGNYGDLIINVPSSKRIKRDAEEYIKRYFGGQKDFVSLMIRLEHRLTVAKTTGNMLAEVKNILQEVRQKWTAVKNRQHLNATFLAFDVGKYGSADFSLLNYFGPMGEILTEIRKFFDGLYNGSISYSEWEDSFMQVSGVKSGSGVAGYVAILQKEIASQGRCIILVGGGSFQQSAGHLHQLNHQGQKQC